MTFVQRWLRRDRDNGEAPTLDARAWRESRESVGSRRPEGWQPEPLVMRRGIRAGASPRVSPRVIQIRVETQ